MIREFQFQAEGATVYGEMDSPVGPLTLIASDEGLHAIVWDLDRNSGDCDLTGLKKSGDQTIIVQTKKQLLEYFQGKRKAFDIPLVMKGTEFQIQAWNELRKIPYGTTISYAQQAEKVGHKNKARAVGTANGHNPISIIIPCHRVIASGGGLGGFGGGLDRKAYLLQLEQAKQAI